MPGAINEMMPDYGCPFQAWTIYGMATGLVSGCFGVEPRADLKEITLTPKLPSKWKSMSLKRLRIGDNWFDLSISKEDKTYTLNYVSEQKGWKIKLRLPDSKGKRITVNNKSVPVPDEDLLLESQHGSIVISQ